MKQFLLLILISFTVCFAFGQVKQCTSYKSKLFTITRDGDKITFTNISDKVLFVFGFCETSDGKWVTNYDDFMPVFPKSREDIQNLQYSCGSIRCTKRKKKLTGNFSIFYYYTGENANLSVNQMKALCTKRT